MGTQTTGTNSYFLEYQTTTKQNKTVEPCVQNNVDTFESTDLFIPTHGELGTENLFNVCTGMSVKTPDRNPNMANVVIESQAWRHDVLTVQEHLMQPVTTWMLSEFQTLLSAYEESIVTQFVS